MTTDVAVPNRPPDRIGHGNWEPYKEGAKTRTFLRATRASVFKVLEYEQVEETHTPWRRKVMEYWYIPARMSVGALIDDGSGVLFVEPIRLPAETIGRFVRWEYDDDRTWDPRRSGI